MRWTEKCDIALCAVRSQARRRGVEPRTLSASEAHAVLDDLARSEPGLVACQWYKAAPDRQVSHFYREWQRWLAQQVVTGNTTNAQKEKHDHIY